MGDLVFDGLLDDWFVDYVGCFFESDGEMLMFLCVLGEFGLGKRKFVMNENMFILIEYWVLFWLVDVGLMLLVWFGFLFFLYVNLLM